MILAFLFLQILLLLHLTTTVLVAKASFLTPPLWPSSYSVDFQEEGHAPGSKPLYTNKGSWYYDFKQNIGRFDKGAGQQDFACQQQAHHLSPNDLHAPCQLLFAKDTNMYVIYPNTKTCCTPCGEKEFCSLIKPNWLSNSTYVGTRVYEGNACYGWEINGSTSKDYWFVTKMNVPCEYHQIPYKVSEAIVSMNFTQESYKTDEPDQSLFIIPSYCKEKCPSAMHSLHAFP